AGERSLAALEHRSLRPPGSGFWATLVNAVMARPVLMTVLSAAVLIGIASPVLRLRTGVTDITGFPATIDGIAAITLLDSKFPLGQDLRLDVVVTHADRPAVQAAIAELEARALQIDGVGGP